MATNDFNHQMIIWEHHPKAEAVDAILVQPLLIQFGHR